MCQACGHVQNAAHCCCALLSRGIDVMDVLITLTTKTGVSLLNSTQVGALVTHHQLPSSSD